MSLRRPFALILMIVLLGLTVACGQSPTVTFTPSPQVDVASVTPVVTATGTMPLTITPMTIVSNLKRVVYAKHDGIWLWDVSAPPQQLTRSQGDASPKISDDGQVVAFVRDGEIWVVDVNGGNEQRLSHNTTQPLFDFAPHSHTLYFQLGAGQISVERGPLNDNLRSGRWVFSQDGRKIAVSGINGIDVVNADGSDLKTVITFLSLNYMPEIVWLPDASGFKTVLPPADPAAATRFMFISADGKIVAKLAEFFAASATPSFISPDGAKVAYTKKQGDKLELHIIDASTADQAYLSHSADSFELLGWTPDSAHILYRLREIGELWFSPQQKENAPLMKMDGIDHLVWVNGQSFLFVQNRELNFRQLGVHTILLDTGLNESNIDFSAKP